MEEDVLLPRAAPLDWVDWVLDTEEEGLPAVRLMASRDKAASNASLGALEFLDPALARLPKVLAARSSAPSGRVQVTALKRERPIA